MSRDAHAEALQQELQIAFDMLDAPGRKLLLVAVSASGAGATRAWQSSTKASRLEVIGMAIALERQKRDLMKAAGLTDRDLDGLDVAVD